MWAVTVKQKILRRQLFKFEFWKTMNIWEAVIAWSSDTINDLNAVFVFFLWCFLIVDIKLSKQSVLLSYSRNDDTEEENEAAAAAYEGRKEVYSRVGSDPVLKKRIVTTWLREKEKEEKTHTEEGYLV